MKQNKKFEEMDEFEKRIAKCLSELGMEYEKTKKVLEEYYEIIDAIGRDESPKEWAKILKEVNDNKITPEQWKKHIKKFENAPLDPWENEELSLTEIKEAAVIREASTHKKASF